MHWKHARLLRRSPTISAALLFRMPRRAVHSVKLSLAARPAGGAARLGILIGMTPALQLEILDLRHFSAGNLRPILEAESRLWNNRLRWDFTASANLLLQYLDSHVLPGYVALENGRIVGYVFCVYEGDKAVIGDVFALPSSDGSDFAPEIERSLLGHIVDLLKNSPGIDRIESQLLLHPHGSNSDPLLQACFRLYERLFMELDLTGGGREDVPPLPTVPEDLELRPWRDADFNPAGHLIAEAYRGHLDSFINDQYRSVPGSLRFLHNIVRFPGCGFFDPAASWVLAGPDRAQIAGLLLCSRVREDVGHVTQICVSQRRRHLGLGALLLAECTRELARRSFQALTLTVTAENKNAVDLYRRRGFVTRHSFDAMVWDQRKE